MLRIIRVALAAFVLTFITLLFLDFTGTLHAWFGWLARIQFLPALMALNVGVLVALFLLTLLFGRVYCSVICPLGIMQDIISWMSGRRGKKQRFRFSYTPARNRLRYTVLALFILAGLLGVGSVVALLAPYSAYGRMVSQLLAPLWLWGNNGLAYLAERAGSYAFYEVDVWLRSLPTFLIALATFVLLAVLAWRHGRSYCNTICPVGTLLGALSHYSLFGIRIDKERCVSCGLCARQCKASCINPAEHGVDASRCVVCMNCLSACHKGAISYGLRRRKPEAAATPGTPASVPAKAALSSAASAAEEVTPKQPADPERRKVLQGCALVLATAAAAKPEKLVDGGLAVIVGKEAPQRRTPIVPPGAHGLRHLRSLCTGCQLCVAACPNGVLRPSATLASLMQPECSYERGFCRPECTKCSEVCPAGAIEPMSLAEKVSTQVGHAVWLREHCVVLQDKVKCGACARHCPVGAITMVQLEPGNPFSPEIPVVNEERCIGCGACENLCPSRPHSAIYVEGHEQHRTL